MAGKSSEARRAQLREYTRKWRLKNRDAELARRRAKYRRDRQAGLPMDTWKSDNPERSRHCERERLRRNPVALALRRVKTRAKQLGVMFNLTEDWFLAHFSQGCETTGLDLDAPNVGGGRRASPWAAHVDRIKAGGDYTMDNCRIVCGVYNLARQDWSDAVVLRMAEALVANKKGN